MSDASVIGKSLKSSFFFSKFLVLTLNPLNICFNHSFSNNFQDEELSGIGGSASSRSNSISSFQSYHSSAPISDSHHGDNGKVITPRPLIPLRVLSSASSDISSINEELDGVDKVIFLVYEIFIISWNEHDMPVIFILADKPNTFENRHYHH